MKKSVNDEDHPHWRVIDVSTGEPIRGVQFADDEKGVYIQRTGIGKSVTVYTNIRLEYHETPLNKV
jgi:hypothetical protein